RLHRIVRLRGGVSDDDLELFAEHALLRLRRYLADEWMAAIDVLHGELPPLQLVLSLLRVGAGARHGDADGDRAALRAGRVRADRRAILGGRAPRQAGQRQPPGQEQAVADELPARVAPGCRTVIAHDVLPEANMSLDDNIVGRY